MLHRLVRENIELVRVPAKDLGLVLADRSLDRAVETTLNFHCYRATVFHVLQFVPVEPRYRVAHLKSPNRGRCTY